MVLLQLVKECTMWAPVGESRSDRDQSQYKGWRQEDGQSSARGHRSDSEKLDCVAPPDRPVHRELACYQPWESPSGPWAASTLQGPEEATGGGSAFCRDAGGGDSRTEMVRSTVLQTSVTFVFVCAYVCTHVCAYMCTRVEVKGQVLELDLSFHPVS